MRLIFVSHGDYATITALIGELDVTVILFGTLLPVFTLGTFWATVAAVEIALESSGLNLPFKLFACLLGILVAGLALSLSSLATVVALVVALVVGILVSQFWNKAENTVVIDLSSAIVPAAITFVLAVVLSSIWLPAEVIAAGQHEPSKEVVYIISSDEEATTVLLRGGGVERIVSTEIISRTICNVGDVAEPLIEMVRTDVNPTPRCDDLLEPADPPS